jgi:hypothetical protein
MGAYGNLGSTGATGAGNSGGNGGNATATATSTGAAGVVVDAYAVGGAGGPGSGGSASGGSGAATASATGTSTGRGQAQATAISSGAGGSASTQSVSNGGTGAVTGVQAEAHAPNPVSANVQSRTISSLGGSAPPQPAPTSLQAFSFATAQPSAADVAAATAGHPNTSALASGPTTDTLALVTFGGGRPAIASPGSSSFTGSVLLTLGSTELAHGAGELELGLIDSQSSSGGFNTFSFALTRTGTATPLIDQTFTSLATAQAYFADNVINLGSIGTGPQGLNFAFNLNSSSNGNAFNVAFLVADVGVVPEPSTSALVGVGVLALIALQRRCRSRKGRPERRFILRNT